MRKSYSLSDDFGMPPPFEDWVKAPLPTTFPAPVGGVIAQPDLLGDDGDPFQLATNAGSGSSSAGSASPVGSIAQLADYLVNGFWAYNSTIAHHWSSNTISYNISGLNAAEQFLAQSALEAWHEVANVTFVQTSGAANITFNHNGSMTAFTSANWTGAGAMTSATVDIAADWITNDGGAYDGKTGIDSYGYQTYIHEIGHALGLGHQGPYNGSASYSSNAIYANDTWQYSVMSYFAQDNYSGSTYRYVVTPQMADIYAVDSIYGAATTRTGDTVYGFHSNAGSVFDFSAYSQAPALTIYDSGGNDTLDGSGYSAAQTIDLHPGAFSSVGGLVHNIGIALNTTIETAIGGSGNDMLIANDSGSTLIGGAGNDTLIGGAGNDRLIGGPGVDTMTGGGGADTFVFLLGDSPASGQHDRITDFTSGTDHIDLSGIDAISSTSAYDPFHFIGISAFDGVAGELDYYYNNSTNVTVVQGDVNGDGVADFAIDLTGNISLSLNDLIGAYATPVTIESYGVTKLVQEASNFYFMPAGGGSGPEFKYHGSPVVAGQYEWSYIGAEKTASGYEVALHVPGTDQYTVWNTDSSGSFVSNGTGGVVVSGTSLALESLEPSFQQDLNGDGVIGVHSTVIESFGSTSLEQLANNFYFVPVGGGTGPEFKYHGSPVAAGQYEWSYIGAEKTASGYEVALHVPGTDQYTVWNTDSSGSFVSNGTGGVVVSGTSLALESLEPSFQQDLNGDGVIGVHSTVIESFGSTSLEQLANNFYFVPVGGGTGPEFKYHGSPVVAGQLDSWTYIGAEQTSSGYEVALHVPGTDQYTVWNTDSNGNFVSNGTGGVIVSGSSAILESLETSFHQDLNGDGTIGVVSSSSASLLSTLAATPTGAHQVVSNDHPLEPSFHLILV
jgi:serralysin